MSTTKKQIAVYQIFKTEGCIAWINDNLCSDEKYTYVCKQRSETDFYIYDQMFSDYPADKVYSYGSVEVVRLPKQPINPFKNYDGNCCGGRCC